MKGVFAAIIVILLLLPAFSYAQNLRIRLYTETKGGGKDFGNLRAIPGEAINAFLLVENQNQDRNDDNQVIEDIDIVLTIEEIDKGDDLEFDFDEFDLRPRRDKALQFDFQVPLEVEDKQYDIIIETHATENNADFTQDEDFSIDISKERDKLYFEKLVFSPGNIKCNEVSNLDMRLYNLGAADEDVTMKIINPGLKLSLQRSFKLESYPDESVYTNKIPVKVPIEAESGKYPFEISLNYASNSLTLKEIAYLDVDCDLPAEKEASEEEQAENEEKNAAITAVKQPITPPAKIVEQKDYSIPLLLAAALLLAVAVLIVVFLKRK